MVDIDDLQGMCKYGVHHEKRLSVPNTMNIDNLQGGKDCANIEFVVRKG